MIEELENNKFANILFYDICLLLFFSLWSPHILLYLLHKEDIFSSEYVEEGKQKKSSS